MFSCYICSMATTGIMVRASLTQDEWTALRKLALDRKARVADLVADALRTVYLEGVKS